MEDELLKALESVANELSHLKHHAVYIRLALQLEDGGEVATARCAVSDDKRSTSNQRQVSGAYQSPPNNLTHI